MSEPARLASTAWLRDGEIQPLGAGYINDTFLLEGASHRYVLQRINPAVFPDPGMVNSQVSRVVTHITGKAPGWVATLVPNLTGELQHEDAEGDLWRVWRYLEGTETRQSLDAVAAMRSAGQAFARFQNLLSDLPGPEFVDPIPGFMQLGHYLALFGQVQPEAHWARFVAERENLSERFGERTGYVHADCKINNLLFHVGQDEVAAVIDLDTVMVGHWAWDFGDLVRSAAIQADALVLDRYEELMQGFVSETRLSPTVDELVFAPRYVTLMLGVRLLTDHLQGDRYFKVSAAGDNLRRAEVQFRALESMELAETGMRKLAERVLAGR